ncbi:MAG: DMT family transporter [Porticoccaceae bacterium]|nr:DMT family transporter [Porticoccaceae bacterium]
MACALLSFCVMAIGARQLWGDINTFQILFFRSVIGVLVTALIIYKSGDSRLFSTARIKMHTARNVFHFAGQYGWFVGLGLLPLAEVFALEFTVPIWTLIIAAIFLKESITPGKTLAVILGAAGVYVILKPGSQVISPASTIVLLAALCFAAAYVFTKSLSNTENPLTVVFYMCLIQLPIGMFLSLSNWVFPNPIQWAWLCAVGLTALSAHYCVTSAMQISEAGIVVTLDFLRLPLIAVVGIVFYNEAFDLALVLGAGLMLFGNLINLSGKTRVDDST